MSEILFRSMLPLLAFVEENSFLFFKLWLRVMRLALMALLSILRFGVNILS